MTECLAPVDSVAAAPPPDDDNIEDGGIRAWIGVRERTAAEDSTLETVAELATPTEDFGVAAVDPEFVADDEDEGQLETTADAVILPSVVAEGAAELVW